jgi:hypothetical protein
MNIALVQSAVALIATNASKFESRVSRVEAGAAGFETLRNVASGQAKRSAQTEWKAERSAWQASHRSVPTEQWLAARTSWMTARDALQSGNQSSQAGEVFPS